MPTKSKPAAETDRALARLDGEYLIPLGELAGVPIVINGVEMRPSAAVLLRWGHRGKSGVYLDVVLSQRHAGWATSREALRRFADQLRRRVALR